MTSLTPFIHLLNLNMMRPLLYIKAWSKLLLVWNSSQLYNLVKNFYGISILIINRYLQYNRDRAKDTHKKEKEKRETCIRELKIILFNK